MGKKVKLAFMVNDSERKISFRKRKKSMIKKMDELTTLCGIEACAIVYSEFDPHPEVWPSPLEVDNMITKFRSYSEFDLGKNKKLDHESHLQQRVQKAKEQLVKMKKNNREIEISFLMYQFLAGVNILDNLNIVDLKDLTWLIGRKLKEISWRMVELDKKASTSQSQGQMVADGATNQGNEGQVDHDPGFEMNLDDTLELQSILNSFNNLDNAMLPFQLP